jgi:hypothetical protein
MAFGGAGILSILPVARRVTAFFDNPVHFAERLCNFLLNILYKLHTIINNVFQRILSLHQLLDWNLVHIDLLFKL